ncbi:hypothetical protein L2E82_31328 [Cichorium intybus]|uniref:Uncharacterized protein n=1 Tax=Cichorium intybus TaxID=13427 RepID=A0ACB9D2P9_CICIN|nr:hypothetical protein L2E82_31328 [Cichorium intybus]
MSKIAATIVLVGMVVCCAVVAVLVAVVASSPTKGWSGRSLSLLDPTYASKYIPIIASVSEHQPPTWPSYFMDLNVLAFLVPVGIIACFSPLSDAISFVILYIVTSACILSGIALSEAFDVFTRSIKFYISGLSKTIQTQVRDAVSNVLETDKKQDLLKEKEKPSKKKMKKEKVIVEVENTEKRGLSLILPIDTSIFALFLIVLLATFYVVHSLWAVAETYSAPSIVLTSHSPEGLHVFDDFREAYAWLHHGGTTVTKQPQWLIGQS